MRGGFRSPRGDLLARSTRTFLLLAALLACASLAAPAQAAHVQCGDTITQDTTLDSDLPDCGEGLTIGADGVTLDLGGHTIEGTSEAAAGIKAGLKGFVQVADLSLRNGTITGYRSGLSAEQVRRYSISEVNFLDNRTGADCHSCEGPSSIVDSEASGGTYGLNLDGSVLVARTEVANNSSIGIQLDYASGTIRNSLIRNNARGIYVAEAEMRIANNRILDNDGAGIEYDYWQDGEVIGNRIERNGTGILDVGSSRISILRNIIRANQGDGARVKALVPISGNRFSWNGGSGLKIGNSGYLSGIPPCRVSRNVAYRNERHGIEVRGGSGGDYGCDSIRLTGNHVHHNGSDGLLVAESIADVLLRGNRAEHNGDDGIDVDSRDFNGGGGSWSPDGSLIAGSASTNDLKLTVQLFEVDGSDARSLVEGTSPTWSPGGTELAYRAADGVHVIGADGSNDRFLAAGSAPQWSPAGDKVLLIDGTDIYAVDAGGGIPVRLATGTDPEWSPVGDKIVYQRANEVHIVNADGTGDVAVTEGGNPTWAPDGERIAVTDGVDLLTIRADGTDPQYLTTDEPVDYAPAWSPDGSRIAFLRSTQGAHEIHVVQLGGGPSVRILASHNYPLWSPASDQLLLGKTIVRLDGSTVAELGLGYNPFVTLRGNIGDRNADLGIEAVDEVTDGGNNRARGNGDPRQCVGVICG
jgi:Tol biopolymer transport system component